MGFSNPIIGGGGALVYPSIHSPDFLTTVSGWTINKDGTAEFNSITIRGSTIVGSVSLWYDGPNPLTAHLIASVASSAGSDGFGHNYKKGVWAYDDTGNNSSVGLVPGSPAQMQIGTGDPAESIAAAINGKIVGSGINRNLTASMTSPAVTGAPANAGAHISMQSNSVSLANKPMALIEVTDGIAQDFTALFSTINVTFSNSTGNIIVLQDTGSLIRSALTRIQPATASTPEVFHSLGSPGIANVTINNAGYAFTVVGINSIDMICVDIALTATGAVAAGVYTFANTLPSNYQFQGSYSRSYECGYNGTVAGGANNSDLLIDGAATPSPGRVRLQIPALPIGTSITVTAFIPLN